MKKGFTLVEIMVAIMIFCVVCVVALAALVKILDSNKRAQTIKDAVTSMSFVMESMTREIRAGTTLYCQALPSGDLNINHTTIQNTSSDCAIGLSSSGGGGVGFAFISSRAASVGETLCDYYITAYEIVPSGSNFIMKKALQTSCADPIDGGDFYPVIDENVTITNYYANKKEGNYPLLFLKLDGTAGNKETAKTYFTLQTATSPRVP